MPPRRHFHLLVAGVLLLAASFAGAGTTEFRVFFDTDRNAGTGCTVGGMNGVEQVLVTQVTESGGSARVTRVFRQLCAGSSLGAITDDDTSGWDAVFQTGSGELTFETRMSLDSFGPDGAGGDMRLGFEANRPPATHVALVGDDGSDAVLHKSAVRRRSFRSSGTARAIILDGNLTDWTGVDSAIYGMAGGGTRELRLLRVFAWEDPAQPASQRFLYFAVVARLASDAPFADDDVYNRQEGQSLSVAGPGVLANDGDPLGEDLDAEIVTEPARGSVALNEEEGGFTYSPGNPQSNAADFFEYKVRAGTRESNVARVRVTVRGGTGNKPPSFDAGGEGRNQTVLEDAGPQTKSSWATGIVPGPAEESSQSVAFEVMSNTNPSLFSAGPAVSPTGVLTYTPAANANGTATIILRLTDDGTPSASSPQLLFTITITPVNDRPSFTNGANPIVVLDTAGAQTRAGWATALLAGPPNESGQALDFLVSSNNPALFSVAPAIAPNGTLTFTPAAVQGVATVTVQIHDDGGVANGGVDTSASRTFQITVEKAPSITSGSGTTFVVGKRGTFAVTATGRPTPSIILTGTLPAGVTFVPGTDLGQGTGTLSGTPAAMSGGRYAISFHAANGGGSGPVQNFTLTVNEAPGIGSAGYATFMRGTTSTFLVTTTGYPPPSIVLSSVPPAGLTFTDRGDGKATLTGRPAAPDGHYGGFTLTASNGIGVSATQAFSININLVVYPMPGSQSAASVLCYGCPGSNRFGQTNDGLPLYPYRSPIARHTGRYVDSQQTANFQHVGFRTARARTMRTFRQANGQAPPRVYIQIGNALGAYALDTFFSSKLPAGPVSVSGLEDLTGSKVGGFGRSPLEKITMWDGFMYPEAIASQWFAPLIDQQDPMAKGGPFDVDDRGYIYASWPSFGWGIARDDGRTDTTHFAKVVQMAGSVSGVDPERYPNTLLDSSGVSAQSILVVPSGGKYYAVIAGASNRSAVFDVTNPSAPLHLSTYPGADKAIIRYDRSDAFQRVAYVDGARNLQVYSYSDLVSGGTAILSVAKSSGGFQDLAFDEAGNIWAIESSRLVKLAPAGGGYFATSYAAPFGVGFGTMSALAVGGGHLAVIGTDNNGAIPAYDVRLATIETGVPLERPLGGFFKNYYHGGLAGYSEPGPYTYPSDLQLIQWKGKTYLMYSAEGLGDVFEIQGGSAQ